MNNYIFVALVTAGTVGVILLLVRKPLANPVHCPACFRLGRVGHYGRYHCSACGTTFLLDEARRPVPTAWRATVGPFVTRLVICLSLLGLGLWCGRGSSGGGGFAGALIALLLLGYLNPVGFCWAMRRKEFSAHDGTA